MINFKLIIDSIIDSNLFISFNLFIKFISSNVFINLTIDLIINSNLTIKFDLFIVHINLNL